MDEKTDIYTCTDCDQIVSVHYQHFSKDCFEYYKSRIAALESFLHSKEMHPDYEYETTEGARKYFDQHEPEGKNWQCNTNRGRDGWERFDYHEEAYWMRKKP